jgi:glycerophosphoryl diester phosphodiesterase
VTTAYKLVGHRGFPQAYPENSLSGILAAIAEGADAVEFDIQVSKDLEPVVIHDDHLLRTTGIDAPLADYNLSLLERISAHEPARFGQTHLPEPITSLATLAKELAKWPEITVFAEIKAEIFNRMSREDVMDKVTTSLRPLASHCYVISFDEAVLHLARDAGFKVGWVLTAMDEASEARAKAWQPDFLIVDIKQVPSTGVWPGAWQWFVYDLVTVDAVQQALALGVTYIETWDIAGLKHALEHL